MISMQAITTLDIDDIARLFQKNRSIVYKILRENPQELPPARRVGRFYFWHPELVSEWLKGAKSTNSSTGQEQFAIVGKRRKGGPRSRIQGA